MYRKRLLCAAYVRMNITKDQTRRLMYILSCKLMLTSLPLAGFQTLPGFNRILAHQNPEPF